MSALSRCNIKWVVKKLIHTGPLNKILEWACRNGHLDLVKMAIEKGADVKYKNNAPMFEACKNGSVEIIKYLLDNGTDKGCDLRCKLIVLEYDRLDATKFLISRNISFEYYLHAACLHSSMELIKFMAEKYGVDGHEPLRAALKRNRMDVAKYLLSFEFYDCLRLC